MISYRLVGIALMFSSRLKKILEALRRLRGSEKENMPADTKVLFDQLTEDAIKLMKDDAYDEKQEIFHKESGTHIIKKMMIMRSCRQGKTIQFTNFHIKFSQFEGGKDRYPDADIYVVCEEWCTFVTSFVFD